MCGFCAITDIHSSHIYQLIVGIAKSEQILRWDTTCHISVSCWLFHTVLSTVSISYTYRTDLHRMPRPVTMCNWIYVWVLCHDISTYRRHCKIWANSKVRYNMPYLCELLVVSYRSKHSIHLIYIQNRSTSRDSATQQYITSELRCLT